MCVIFTYWESRALFQDRSDSILVVDKISDEMVLTFHFNLAPHVCFNLFLPEPGLLLLWANMHCKRALEKAHICDSSRGIPAK